MQEQESRKGFKSQKKKLNLSSMQVFITMFIVPDMEAVTKKKTPKDVSVDNWGFIKQYNAVSKSKEAAKFTEEKSSLQLKKLTS